ARASCPASGDEECRRRSARLVPVNNLPESSPPPSFAPMSARFRGYLPVVVDVETGGFNWNRHALLEIAVRPVDLDENGRYVLGEGASAHVVPAPGTTIDPKSLQITGIDLDHPF